MEIEQNETAPADVETVVEETPEVAPSSSPEEALRRAFAADLDEGKAEEAPEAVEVKDGPARGPDGKFAPKQPKEEPEAGGAESEAKGGAFEAPARFSADAKAAWANAPAPVKAEVTRAMRELETGIEQYREQVAPIKPFLEMAQKSGTTLDAALQRYVNTENMLRNNPVQGLAEIGRNLGLSQQQMGQMLLGQGVSAPSQDAQYIQRLESKIAQLEQGVGNINQTFEQQREAQIFAEIESFAAQRPRFHELKPEIARMLDTGYADDLADAYEKADRLNPAAPQQQAATPAPAQTRKAAQSLTGAPSGSNPAVTRAPSSSPEEALRRAFGM